MPKQILLGEKARTKVFEGVEKLSLSVLATLGPKGRNAMIERRMMSPMVTKDGVTVAKEIELEDPYENMGAQLVKEAATKTNDAAGDGTTTATVLAYAMMDESQKHLGDGANPILIKSGMEKAVIEVVAQLGKLKKKITNKDEMEAIATISSQDKVIGMAIADIIEKSGDNGVITIEKGQTLGLESEFIEGMQLDTGYISHYFVTDTSRMQAVFENAGIFVTDMKLTNLMSIKPLLEEVHKAGTSLVIIADNVEGDALASLVMNKMKGVLRVVAIKAPAFGDRRKEMLKDICALTGASFISEELGRTFESATLKDLGGCRTLTTTKDTTTIVGGHGSKKGIRDRVDAIRIEAENTKDPYEKEKLQERYAKLTGGVAVIKVGAATEVEQKEKQHRVEDALSATRAAVEEGIVAGGGTALIRCLPALEKLQKATEGKDEKIGIEIVKQAIVVPAFFIAQNAGASGAMIVAKICELKGSNGYNALTGKFEDLIGSSVIDPKKVTRLALENAVSVASMFVTLEVAITDIPKKEDLDRSQR